MISDAAPSLAQYLTFELAGASYGLPVQLVKEILQYEDPTVVPGAPPSVRGILNLRGGVVPVLDLARKLGLGSTVPTKLTCVVVVDANLDVATGTIGVLADAVTEVATLAPGEIQPPPSFGREATDFLTGLARSGNGFVLLLDIERVLASPDGEVAAWAREALPAASDAAARMVAASAEPSPPTSAP